MTDEQKMDDNDMSSAAEGEPIIVSGGTPAAAEGEPIIVSGGTPLSTAAEGEPIIVSGGPTNDQ